MVRFVASEGGFVNPEAGDRASSARLEVDCFQLRDLPDHSLENIVCAWSALVGIALSGQCVCKATDPLENVPLGTELRSGVFVWVEKLPTPSR